MTEDQISTAQTMWMAGFTAKKIAAAIGKTDRQVADLAFRRRDLFPHRTRDPHDGRKFIVAAMPKDPSRPLRGDCMRWVTEQGATVTLPKISFIECPRAAA